MDFCVEKYRDMTVVELRKKCRSCGINVNGKTKSALVEELTGAHIDERLLVKKKGKNKAPRKTKPPEGLDRLGVDYRLCDPADIKKYKMEDITPVEVNIPTWKYRLDEDKLLECFKCRIRPDGIRDTAAYLHEVSTLDLRRIRMVAVVHGLDKTGGKNIIYKRILTHFAGEEPNCSKETGDEFLDSLLYMSKLDILFALKEKGYIKKYKIKTNDKKSEIINHIREKMDYPGDITEIDLNIVRGDDKYYYSENWEDDLELYKMDIKNLSSEAFMSELKSIGMDSGTTREQLIEFVEKNTDRMRDREECP